MKKSNHEWSKDAFFSKAQLYSEVMAEHEGSNWQFGLWSAFVLEMLIRAGIAATSPVLIADNKDWNNLLYALDQAPKKPRFVPKSATITTLIKRIENLCSDFTREHSSFCTSHIARRNSEVHTGSMPFENMGSSTWLPGFYQVCEILVLEIDESLESLFGKEVAVRAKEEIVAFKDSTAKSVKGTINAHKTLWESKSTDEQHELKKQAESTLLRNFGHRVSCPGCSCIALLHGKPAGEGKRTVDDDGIVERQVMKPESFYCKSCGLKISGYSKLLAAGLGDTYLSTSYYDALEFFDIDLDEQLRQMLAEDDYNE